MAGREVNDMATVFATDPAPDTMQRNIVKHRQARLPATGKILEGGFLQHNIVNASSLRQCAAPCNVGGIEIEAPNPGMQIGRSDCQRRLTHAAPQLAIGERLARADRWFDT